MVAKKKDFSIVFENDVCFKDKGEKGTAEISWKI